MEEHEVMEVRRMLGPHTGGRVSVTHKDESGGHETVAARLSGVFNHGLTIGSESIPYEEIEELSLHIISGGKVSVAKDLVPK